MTTMALIPDPRDLGLPAVVWEQYLKADKGRVQILRACAAWIAVPAPVDAILTGAPS